VCFDLPGQLARREQPVASARQTVLVVQGTTESSSSRMKTWAHRPAYGFDVATFPRPTWWQDWAVPAVLLIWAQGEIWLRGLSLIVGPRWLFAVIAIACAGALLVRRSHPISAAATVAVLMLCPLSLGFYARATSCVLMLVVTVFAGGRYARRPGAYLAVPIGSFVALMESVRDPAENLASSWGWSLNTVWIFALGAAFRHERLLRQQVADASAARSQADAAQERLRVARELHDVLSHSLAVVVVQAEVADAFLDSDAARSREAIRNVAATGRAALSDTRRIVGLLRDDTGTQGSPLPGLADVPALVDRVRESGLPVSLEIADTLPTLAADATATAYRVVQEALTNVMRHAGQVSTRVGVGYEHGAVIIDVCNQAAGAHGIP
jgi:signal transduction histidine kinase